MDSSMTGFPVFLSLPDLALTHSIELVRPSNHLTLLLLPSTIDLNISQHQGLFPMSWPFASGGQRIGASAIASVLPKNI